MVGSLTGVFIGTALICISILALNIFRVLVITYKFLKKHNNNAIINETTISTNLKSDRSS